MSAISEVIRTIYDLKWAKKYHIEKKDIKWVLKLIQEVSIETDHDEDDILTVFLYLYHKGNLKETLLDKFEKKNKKNAGKLVKFSKY